MIYSKFYLVRLTRIHSTTRHPLDAVGYCSTLPKEGHPFLVYTPRKDAESELKIQRTTPVSMIMSILDEGEVKFRTQNSIYSLTVLEVIEDSEEISFLNNLIVKNDPKIIKFLRDLEVPEDPKAIN